MEIRLQCVVYDSATSDMIEFHDCDKGIHLIRGKQVEHYEDPYCLDHRKEIEEKRNAE